MIKKKLSNKKKFFPINNTYIIFTIKLRYHNFTHFFIFFTNLSPNFMWNKLMISWTPVNVFWIKVFSCKYLYILFFLHLCRNTPNKYFTKKTWANRKLNPIKTAMWQKSRRLNGKELSGFCILKFKSLQRWIWFLHFFSLQHYFITFLQH